MIILDTNVVSELMRKRPDPRVIAWVNDLGDELPWTTATTIFEIRVEINGLAEGLRREELEKALAAVVSVDLEDRVIPFDSAAADVAGRLFVVRRRKGYSNDIRDVEIAGMALSRGASLATRNGRHFEDCGLNLINPWGDED